MALKKCKECGKDVSKNAKACPNCGAPVSSKQYGCGTLILVLLVLGVVGSMLSNLSTNTSSMLSEPSIAEQAAMKERVRVKLQNELETNRSGMISEVQSLIEKGEYQTAYGKADRFKQFDDQELSDLAAKAWKMNTGKEELRILAKLRGIPASKYEQNIDEHAKLIKLFPENEQYRDKLKHYRSKLSEQKASARKKQQERLAKFGEMPTASAWDGSYVEVKDYLKQVANDPKSIDMAGCTKVYLTDGGWVVGCDYRGKNAFGGVVRNSNWFTIRHGRVVKMKDASAYNP